MSANARERGFIAKPHEVRAILAGRQARFRRVVKLSKELTEYGASLSDIYKFSQCGFRHYAHDGEDTWGVDCPFGSPGDRLWCKETWQAYHCVSHEHDEWEPLDSPKNRHDHDCTPVYRADGKSFPDKWLPSIFMPREFSRITLQIESVRVERLQDISEEDAIAEGVECVRGASCSGFIPCANTSIEPRECECADGYVNLYANLWESINGPGSWSANPWVWVVEFSRLEGGEG